MKVFSNGFRSWLIAIMFCPGILLSQTNLVPNGSFEKDGTITSDNISNLQNELIRAPGFNEVWFSPTGGTPDWFHENACDNAYQGPACRIDVPRNQLNTNQDIYARSGKAYAGLKFHRGKSRVEYVEYISTKLAAPLLPGKRYRISFYAYLTYGNAEDILSDNHPIKTLQAYLSKDEPTQQATAQVYPLPPGVTPQVTYDETPFLEGGDWKFITEDYTVPDNPNVANINEELHYITIGNFTDVPNWNEGTDFYYGNPKPHYTLTDLDAFGRGIAFDSYYFIDDVSIRQIPLGVECLECDFDVEVDLKPDSDPGECCYNVKILTKEFACPVKKIVLNLNGASLTETFPIAKGPGQIIIMPEFCVDKYYEDKEMTITYYDANDEVLCTQKQKVKCKCNCTDLRTQTSDLISIYVEPTANCCFDIYLDNKSNCDFEPHDYWDNPLTFIKMMGEGSELVDVTVSGHTNYTPGPIELDNKGGVLKQAIRFTAPNNIISVPNQTRIKIGTVCFPNGAVNQDLTFRIENEFPANTYCKRNFQAVVNCEPAPTKRNCCDDFIFNVKKTNDCKLLITVTKDPASPCEVFAIGVLKVIGPYQTTKVSFVQSTTPLAFPSVYTGTDPIHATLPLPGSYYVELLDEFGNIICARAYSGDCAWMDDCPKCPDNDYPLAERKGAYEENKPSTPQLSVAGFNISPNPSDQTSYAKFVLQTEGQVLLEIYDINGQLMQTIQNTRMNPGSYALELKTNKLPIGTHILKLTVNNEVYTINLQVIR